jgi:hypothetical protein
MDVNSFKIIFPYQTFSWKQLYGVDEYDIRFVIKYPEFETFAQGYFNAFSLIESPGRLFGRKNKKSEHYGTGASGAMHVIVQKKDENKVSVLIKPQYFSIPYLPYSEIERVELFLNQYSKPDDEYSVIKHWKRVMQEYVDHYKQNEQNYVRGHFKETLRIEFHRTPIFFHMTIAEYIKEIIHFQESILLKPITGEDKYVKKKFDGILRKNRQLLNKFN